MTDVDESVPRLIDHVPATGQAVRAHNDWYQDGPEAIEALLRAEPFSGTSWDPACGIGTIPKAMLEAGHICIGSDIADRGYGFPALDFLTVLALGDLVQQRTGWLFGFTPANIVSNPPFDRAILIPFIDRALSLATHKVAMLLPLTFLEGQERARWLETTPLACVHVFSWRISMPPGELLAAGKVKAVGGKKAFAWFVFEHGWKGPAQVHLLRRPVPQ